MGRGSILTCEQYEVYADRMQTIPASRAVQIWRPALDRARGPIYLAIADEIERAVDAGELVAGDRLPPHRALAAGLGVDLTTVTRAYAEARRRGLLDGVVGRGTFVRAARGPMPRDPAPGGPDAGGPDSGPDTVDLGMNLPPQPAEPALPELMRRGLSGLLAGPHAPGLLGYRRGAGTGEERAAGAAWLRPTLGDVDPARVSLCPGAQPALLAALGAVAQPGDTVLTDALTYPGFRAAAARLGVRLAGVPADADGLVPDAVDAACRASRPRALYCIPTIQNPTAATMPRSRRRALAEVAARHGLRIIEDDAYGLLPSEPLPALAALAPGLTYHVATLSKALSPALRVAYLVAPDPAEAARLAASLRANTLMASPLLTGLATAWVRDGSAHALLGAIRRECAARQRAAREALPAGSFDAHPEGLHLWLRLPPRRGRLEFVSRVRQQGLALVPSDAFAVEGAAPPDAVRVSLGAAPGLDRLRPALRRMAAALQEDAPAPFLDVV